RPGGGPARGPGRAGPHHRAAPVHARGRRASRRRFPARPAAGGGTIGGGTMSRASGAVGAIVLTGGRGSRLGVLDKARLTVSGRPMVETVLRAAREVAGRVITVGPGGDTREDPPHSGPVAGIAAGLASVPEEVDVVVV